MDRNYNPRPEMPSTSDNAAEVRRKVNNPWSEPAVKDPRPSEKTEETGKRVRVTITTALPETDFRHALANPERVAEICRSAKMYQQHARDLIQPWAQDTPENFRDVCRFVLLTIRMPLFRAVADFKTLTGGDETADGREFEDTVSSALFGIKAKAWAVMGLDYDEWWVDLWSIYREPGATFEDVEAEMLAYLVRNVPGLGFVKAGFVLQIVWGLSGCIDTHNLNRFGIPENKFRAPPSTQKYGTVIRKCRAYNAMVRQIGGTEGLWNSWCAYVADNQPNTYASADTVSRLHAEAFNLI